MLTGWLLLMAVTVAQTEQANRSRLDASFNAAEDEQAKAIAADSGKIVAPGAVQKVKHFRAGMNLDISYQSNADLSGRGGRGDVLIHPSLDVGYNRALGHGFTVDASIRQEAFYFARLDELDFWGTFGDARLSYRPVKGGPTLFASAQPYRYENMDTGDQFVAALNVVAGATQNFVFNSDRSAFYFGYRFNNTFASPALLNSDTHQAVAGFNHFVTDRLMGQLYGLFEYADYQDVVREDRRFIVGLQWTYRYNDWLSFRLNTSFIENDSTNSAFEFQNFAAGAGSSVLIRF